MIANDYIAIAKRQKEIRQKCESSNLNHIFADNGKCIYCEAYRGSIAALYHPHCLNAPGAQFRNNHNFERPSGICSKCLAAQSSLMANHRCPK